MTILPKKKHQESRKNEQDHDSENRSRNRNRSRDIRAGRTQQHSGSDDLSHHSGESSNFNHSSSTYSDLEKHENQDGNGLPNKRSRHNRDRQQTNFYYTSSTSAVNSSLSRRSSRDGSKSPAGNEDEHEDGYNSSDEYDPPKGPQDDENVVEQESDFERQLHEKKGYIIKQMATDGACMFRAVADQVYGDQEMHGVVRRHCMDYMVKNRDFFSPYITEDFTSYIRRKRNEHSHGNHIEMQALSEMYNRPIEVYQYSCVPINTFHGRTPNTDEIPPIRLSYHGSVHYNSIIDPYNPTVGVGLGLAGYKPDAEDDRLLNKASKESESLLLEQAMLEDKLKATDWEATDEQLAEIAARESYLQWLKDQQKCATNSEASSSKSTSTKSRRSPPRDDSCNAHRSPRESHRLSPPREHKETRRSPSHNDTSELLTNTNNKQSKSQSQNNSSPTSNRHPSTYCESNTTATAAEWAYALDYETEWGSDPVLAAVLAQSQQDYLKSLSKTKSSSSDSNGGGSSSKS